MENKTLNKYIEDNFNRIKKRYVNEMNKEVINHNSMSIEDIMMDVLLITIEQLKDETDINVIESVVNNNIKKIKLTQHKRPLQLFDNSQYIEDDEELEEPEPSINIANYILSFDDSNYKINVAL